MQISRAFYNLPYVAIRPKTNITIAPYNNVELPINMNAIAHITAVAIAVVPILLLRLNAIPTVNIPMMMSLYPE